MASRRGGEFWLGVVLGIALVAGWLVMLAYNAMPYLQGGAAQPPPLTLLTQLVTPPALSSVIAPDLATLAGWALAVVIVAMAVTIVVIAARGPHPASGHLQAPVGTPLEGKGRGEIAL